RGETPSAAATSFMLRPSARTRTTSRWRGVKVPAPGAAGSASVARTSSARSGLTYRRPRSTAWSAAMSSCPAACLTTNPEAPARSTSAATWALACMVRTTTRAAIPSALSWRSASSPLNPGMARSVTIRSGRSRRATSTNSDPLATVPIRANSPCRRLASPSATMAWSSASNTVARGILGLDDGDHDAELSPSLGLGVDRQASAHQAGPLVQAEETEAPAAPRGGLVESGSVVRDGEHDVGPGTLHGHVRLAGCRMLGDVAERLLHDP